MQTRAKNQITKRNFWQYYWLVIVLLSALIAAAVDVWLTRSGAGASGDAVHYMQGADNLLAGHGFSRLKANGQYLPITGFPPGFSFALAGLELVGMPAFDAGRYLNALLFGLNTFLVGWLVYRATRSGLLAIVGSWLFMYARNNVQIHAWVMSEPLFIFLALLSIVLLDLYLQRGKFFLLILASLAIAFASLTRYVGLALVPAAFAALLWLNPKKWTIRWRDVLISGVISLLPLIAWFGRNAFVSGNLFNRQLIYHPITTDLIFTLFNEISYWWFAPSLSLPWKLRWGLLVLFFALGVGIHLIARYRWRVNQSGMSLSPIPVITGVLASFFVIVLLLNTSFIDASTDEASIKRYAIPLVAVGIIWTLSSFALISRQGWGKHITTGVLFTLGVGMTLFYASKSVPFVLHPGFSFGYTDDRLNWTCEVNLLKAVDPKQVTITNDYEEFYFLAGRPAYALTGKYDPYLNRQVDDFSSSIDSVQSLLRSGAVLALLGNPDAYPNEANALIGDMGLRITSGCSHLRFYAMPASP